MTPRRGRAARRALVGFVVAVTVAVGLAWPAQARMTATYTVFTWNVAGWAMHRGSVTDELVPTVSSAIQGSGAQLVALNELCEDQYRALVVSLRAAGWPDDRADFARFEPHGPDYCGGQAFGVAIFSKAPLGDASRFVLSSDGTEEGRRLLCAPLASRVHLRFCTSHVTWVNNVVNGERATATQLNEVLSRLESFNAAGDTVLLAGDLNAQPQYRRLDAWYSPAVATAQNSSNTGAYRELDDTDARCPGYGEATTPGTGGGLCGQPPKIDLIFVRANHIVGPHSADALDIPSCGGSPCSDHRPLTGTVRVSVG
ncbi:MAG: endonuclease/exonuclease/phosphatase family protein [Ornithinibacter sp.]